MRYPAMRRQDRALSREEAMVILREAEYGVLSTVGADGAPYGVALNYVVDGDGVYFHCAMTGHKIDNLRHESRVSFVAASNTKPVYKNDYTTLYESAVVHGTTAEVTDEGEKTRILKALCEKYFPDMMDKFDKSMPAMPKTGVWKIQMDHLTGKAQRQ